MRKKKVLSHGKVYDKTYALLWLLSLPKLNGSLVFLRFYACAPAEVSRIKTAAVIVWWFSPGSSMPVTHVHIAALCCPSQHTPAASPGSGEHSKWRPACQRTGRVFYHSLGGTAQCWGSWGKLKVTMGEEEEEESQANLRPAFWWGGCAAYAGGTYTQHLSVPDR